jgi:hypothetical protein
MKRPLCVELLFRRAPSGTRPHYRFVLGQYGSRDLIAVAADWSSPDSHVWVCIQTGQAARAACAADAAEDSAARAEAYCAAAMAARRLVWATEHHADPAAAERVATSFRAAYSAAEEALQAAADAHEYAMEAAATGDAARAADLADTACAAAARAAKAAGAAAAACDEAQAAALAAGVGADELSRACNAAWDVAYARAERDYGEQRDAREPRWRMTEARAGDFRGQPKRALAAFAFERLGVARV